VITGDLRRALGTPVSCAGTWRPAPPGSGGSPGSAASPGVFATGVAFLLARDEGRPAATIATELAQRLRPLDWVSEATVTGGGYVTVTVTADALARLAVRVAQAGPACARSDALAGTALTAPAAAALASAPSWRQARERLAVTVCARLAQAAGARVTWTHDAERIAVPGSPARPPASPGGPVAGAIAFAGADAVTYTLARLPPGTPARLDARLAAAHDLGNPAYAVRYAHAHAASTLRQAADLGLDRGDAAGFQPWLLAHPCERALLGELSWLPERVGEAARRRRPDVCARALEGLAGAYLDCQETCPAVRPGTGAARQVPGERAVSAATARLWLAEAARTALCAGLGLLGVTAPDRL